jgi:hypothetical protein
VLFFRTVPTYVKCDRSQLLLKDSGDAFGLYKRNLKMENVASYEIGTFLFVGKCREQIAILFRAAEGILWFVSQRHCSLNPRENRSNGIGERSLHIYCQKEK